MFSPGIGGGGEARLIRLASAPGDPLEGDSPGPPLGGERLGVGVLSLSVVARPARKSPFL